jgi:hypothetical protein
VTLFELGPRKRPVGCLTCGHMAEILWGSVRSSITQGESVSKLQDDRRRLVYEPPTLKVIGTVSGLTLGPTGGPLTDGVFPHHGSG